MATLAEPVAVAPGLGLGGQVGYGFGQIAGQVFRDVPSLLLLFFMTTVLGISPRRRRSRDLRAETGVGRGV